MEWKLFADLAEAAGRKRIELDLQPDATVGEALEDVLADHPGLEQRVCENGDLREDINILRNGTDVFAGGDGLETPVEPGDELAMFPPVSGG
jgi:molybdopterin synthase sulfur carrier subunit